MPFDPIDFEARSHVPFSGWPISIDDLMPYYLRASVFVAPLMASGGLKFKVPQAMLCGLPVVATTVAAEGVVEVAPADALWAVTNDPDEFARQIVAALTDTNRAALVGRRAAAWARQHYSFALSIERLDQIYARLAAGRR